MPPVSHLLLYARDPEETARFYVRHFGYELSWDEDGRIAELSHPDGGTLLMLHRAGKGQKAGQSTVKLVFTVPDVAAFIAACAATGLDFGPLHQADGYAFANTKDPCGNSISVSGRALRPD